jgi:hypothetical protein
VTMEIEGTDPRAEGDDEHESQELEAEIMRADRPFASGRFGETAREAREGEGLDRALAQEVPEPDRVEEDVEIRDEAAADTEDQLIGEAVVEADPFTPPEEAAMEIEDEAPGGVDRPDKGFDDDLEAVDEYLRRTQGDDG